MAGNEHDRDVQPRQIGVNPGYAAFQIAKALTTSEEHADPAVRDRAQERIAKWATILGNVLTGALDYGSRRPVEDVPPWVTLEVATGGFATGTLLAGGPLQAHEEELLDQLGRAPAGEDRSILNAHFLTDDGLDELRERLRTACYDVGVPEEGALMVVAWLVERGYKDEARQLLEDLAPYMSKLRFYPLPLEHPQRQGSRVHLQDVGQTIQDLRRIKPNHRILAQKEAVEIWAPFYDRMVALVLETVESGWPCRNYPADWPKRAMALIAEYAELRKEHQLCGKPERAKGHFAQLRQFLARCARNPESITGREVGRIRVILNRYLERRNAPDSLDCAEARRRQQRDVRGPTFQMIAEVIVSRLEEFASSEGLDDVSCLKQNVSQGESARFGIPSGTLVPVSIQRKAERCLQETAAILVERGLITSAESLARVLPQVTSGLRAAGISDSVLRHLYATVYRAFRRRRSLLLLNLAKQVQIEELPWVGAMDRFRDRNPSVSEIARQTLQEVVVLTIASFPHMILPNKLVQELRAVVKDTDLRIPLVDELAADIFMGQFSEKFLESAKTAASLLDGTLYATYFGIDYQKVRRIPETSATRTWFWQQKRTGPNSFAELCASRAGVDLGTRDPATNGMIIEQQQILTTQNLAVLFAELNLTDVLQGQLDQLAKQCFGWICRRHLMKIDQWHARLVMVKNTAYAWRQMVFFLALVSSRKVADFLGWAEVHLGEQRMEVRNRLQPALKGLVLAAKGCPLDTDSAMQAGARRFLGWSNARHWLLDELPSR